MKYVWLCLLVLGVNLFAAYGVYIWLPDYRGALLLEDGVVENISALLFFIAFIVGLRCFFKVGTYKKTLTVVYLTALLGFLDELSFGERLFNLKMPRIFGVQIDGAHDFFSLFARVLDEMPRLYAALIILIFLGVFLGIVWKYGRSLVRKTLRVYGVPPTVLAALFGAQLLSAMLIDLEMVRHDLLFVLEEQLEMNAAIALIFCSLSLCNSSMRQQNTLSQGE